MLDLYTLDIPNKEVRLGLMESLLPYYVNNKTPEATTMVAYLFMIFRMVIWMLLYTVCRNFCLRFLTATIQGSKDTISRSFISYSVCWDITWMWRFVLLVAVDIVLRTKTTLYVMELKLDKSVGEAMEQIDLKNYSGTLCFMWIACRKGGCQF